jgi:fatty-acyl-CoA synthase
VYPRVHASTNPDKPALIMAGSGEVVTYRELDERSCRLARLFWDAGLRAGDHVAIFMENHARYFDVAWAALRSGLYLTPVSSYLTADEAAYVVNDCQARVLVTSVARRTVAQQMVADTPAVEVRLTVGGAVPGMSRTTTPSPATRPSRSTTRCWATPCSTARARPADPRASSGR